MNFRTGELKRKGASWNRTEKKEQGKKYHGAQMVGWKRKVNGERGRGSPERGLGDWVGDRTVVTSIGTNT